MSNVYVLGIDMMNFGRFPERTVPQLGAQAALMALDDAGLTIQQVQALYCGNLGEATAMVGQRILHQIGQTGVPVVNCANACATGATAFREAWISIKAGLYDVVLAVGVEQMGRGLLGGGAKANGISVEGLLGSGTMPAVFGEAGLEHSHKYGTTFEQFAKVSVKNHHHSTLNPKAMYRMETPLDVVMNAEMIAYPNTKLMCSVNVDGAAAAVLVSERRAKELGMKRAVLVKASVLTSDPWQERDLVLPDVNTCTRNAAQQAYEMAAVGPDDLDLVELHDCFATAEILHYENLRLCADGEGGKLIDAGETALGGRIPVNVSGGLLSKGHPLGATGIANIYEVCMHLRGEAGERQVPEARLGLTHVIGLGSACGIHILERPSNQMSTEDLHRPLYVPDLLVNALSQTPNRPLLQLDGGEMLTIGKVRDATSQFVQALHSLGVGRGNRVATLSTNRPEVLYIGNAIQLLGAIGVPMHPLSALPDHLHVVLDAQVDVLVFEAGRFDKRVAELSERAPGVKLIALGKSPHGEDLCELVARFTPAPLAAARVEGNTIARLTYSGGTTGKAKALATTHRSSLACASILLAEFEWPNPPRVLVCAPLSHAGSALVLPTLLKQGTLLIHPSFDPVKAMQAIQEYRINCMLLVPTMIYALLDHPRFHEFNLSSLETVFYGASSIAPARLKEAIERIGPVFFQFYGQAEAPMTITVLRKAEHDVTDMRRLASCGRPVPWIRVELLDSNLRPVPDGEPGEICVQGPLVMDAYRDNPELTAQALQGGWLHTGDVAVRDPGGFLRIVDRTKDMIVSGGFNIYPREIEDIIGEHPSVSQVAVFGVSHPKWGEAVTALVVPRAGQAPKADELIAMVAERKGKFQAPKVVEFVDSIPQTPLGKPDKKALRARYAQRVS